MIDMILHDMILKNLEPYVRNYLQKEWSDYWKVTYDENAGRIDCIWNEIDSTKIEFIYDYEDQELIFHSNEHQPVGDLVDMLTFLSDKVHEILEELSQNHEAVDLWI